MSPHCAFIVILHKLFASFPIAIASYLLILFQTSINGLSKSISDLDLINRVMIELHNLIIKLKKDPDDHKLIL